MEEVAPPAAHLRRASSGIQGQGPGSETSDIPLLRAQVPCRYRVLGAPQRNRLIEAGTPLAKLRRLSFHPAYRFSHLFLIHMRLIALRGVKIHVGGWVERIAVDPAAIAPEEYFPLLKLRGEWDRVHYVAYSRAGPCPNPHATNLLQPLGFDTQSLIPYGDVIVLGYDPRSGHARSLCLAALNYFTTIN